MFFPVEFAIRPASVWRPSLVPVAVALRDISTHYATLWRYRTLRLASSPGQTPYTRSSRSTSTHSRLSSAEPT